MKVFEQGGDKLKDKMETRTLLRLSQEFRQQVSGSCNGRGNGKERI